MIKEVNIQQDTEEWLKFRKNYVGSSEAPIIMGVNPWTTPNMLWRRRLGLEPESPMNDAMLRGKRLESNAREKFIEQSGIFVKPKVYTNEKYPWMAASMDGVSDNEKFAVEIKCPGSKDHECALDGEIPSKYIPQLVHQIVVGEFDKLFYFSFNESSYKMLEFNLNDYDKKELIKAEKLFWDCLNDLKEPALTDRDYVQKYEDDLIIMSAEWKKLIEEKKKLEEREEVLKEEIIKKADGKNILVNGLKVGRSVRKGNVDYKLIPELKDVNLEKYRKDPIVSWRFSYGVD